MTATDRQFITNAPGENLLERFKVLIKDTRFFDVLVGYFYTSGFHALYKSLASTEKIRILIGISTSRDTATLIQEASSPLATPTYVETKTHYSDALIKEMNESQDRREVEEGIQEFIEWLRSGKLEIKAHHAQNLHAKLYIMTFKEGDKDIGRVITGSSNFTRAGLADNLEFNVELKNRGDYEFALKQFNTLWKEGVDVKEIYLQTIEHRTWLNNSITPYQLYLKFLYEYFKDSLKITGELDAAYRPAGFKDLKYQREAVLNAKKILSQYMGVFLSDVVGLGKTYMAAMLANELGGRHLVLAPPALLEEKNPGSWRNVFTEFGVRGAYYESIGKLSEVFERHLEYENVFIDEAHRFRTESTLSYEDLMRICRGKKVILVTATPFNNYPSDILSQIRLFQPTKKSNIPSLPNLEYFFASMKSKLEASKKQGHSDYLQTAREVAREIRDKVLKYIMVRRTRSEIDHFYAQDLKKQKFKFPTVQNPEPIFYEFTPEEDRIFQETIQLIAQDFSYARYKPLLYCKEPIGGLEKGTQENLGKFMKILLLKRLESSFFAFKRSIDRFISSHERFIEAFDKGIVYISGDYESQILDYLENDDDEAIQKLIDEEKVKKYDASDFKPVFRKALQNDLTILRRIHQLWSGIEHDPKLSTFVERLRKSDILKRNKLIIFTESKETAEYLSEALRERARETVITFTGSSHASRRDEVIANFDANSKEKKDAYRILVTTDVLAEGVNLHRSNVVINYDLPWNPTRMMQRVGRVNRVDTPYEEIHTFNFFPTSQTDSEIKLREVAEAKIHTFISMLGADSRLLTDGEPIESHELFTRLLSKETLSGEEEELEFSELKYLQVIRDIRDNSPDLFNTIKQLPKKSRTARKIDDPKDALLTYFRKGGVQKFYLANQGQPKELDFFAAAKILEASPNTKREPPRKDFYPLLDLNKKAFEQASIEEIPPEKPRRGLNVETKLLRILEIINVQKFTEEQEEYLRIVKRQLAKGALGKIRGVKNALKEIGALPDEERESNPLKVLSILEKNIPVELLREHAAEYKSPYSGTREVILSEYLTGAKK